MPDTELDPLEPLVKPHLAARLDPHLGKAAQAFTAHLRETAAPAAAPPPASRRLLLWWTPAIAALAACLIVGLVLRQQRPPTDPVKQVTAAPTAAASDLEIQRTLSWQNYDEGTFMIDEHTPVRRVRRQILETARWYDPRARSTVEVSIPREELMLIGLDRQ